jgi:hypothetical protein
LIEKKAKWEKIERPKQPAHSIVDVVRSIVSCVEVMGRPAAVTS